MQSKMFRRPHCGEEEENRIAYPSAMWYYVECVVYMSDSEGEECLQKSAESGSKIRSGKGEL